jgi:hypothetical protein
MAMLSTDEQIPGSAKMREEVEGRSMIKVRFRR